MLFKFNCKYYANSMSPAKFYDNKVSMDPQYISNYLFYSSIKSTSLINSMALDR